MIKEIVPFDIKELTETNIALMQEQCEEMVIDEKGKGYIEVKTAHVKVKGLKRAVTDRHKELKAEHLKECQILDGERRRIYGLLDPIIDALAAKRQVEDDRKAEIRAAKERKEQVRIDGIRARINGIKEWCYQGIGYGIPSGDIKRLLPILKETLADLTEADYMEYLTETQDFLNAVIESTKEALEARLQMEKDLVAAKIETKRLAEIKKKQDAEQERLDADRRRIEEEKAKIEQAERDRKIKEKAEAKAKADAERQIQEAKEAQIKAEIAAKEAKERAEREVKEKIKREARETEERKIAEEMEKKRKEKMLPDQEKLIAYAEAIDAIPIPTVKATSMKTILSEAEADLQIITNRIIRKVKELL